MMQWLLGLSLFCTMPVFGADWSAESLPRYDQLFQRTNGWIGADGDFTVTLRPGVALWLFSDTFVGQVREGHRTQTTMINNSAAWQYGPDSVRDPVRFFYTHSATGKPASLITPAEGKGWFWLYDGVMAEGKLFLFLEQFEHTANHPSAFGFRQTGVSLGEISNPLASPTQWQVVQRPIPFGRFGTSEHRLFGSSVLTADGFIYIYGARDQPGADRTMILARAPETSLADFSAWEFRTRSGWSTNADALADLCGRMATEYSVSWLPALKQYVLICTDKGLSDKIMARTAPEPWGPWSEATVAYRCPEMAWDKQNFCYAAKAHPMLAEDPDELIVTYAANSYNLGHALNDGRLYWPRFVRVKLK